VVDVTDRPDVNMRLGALEFLLRHDSFSFLLRNAQRTG
jgi:hypothetical protein